MGIEKNNEHAIKYSHEKIETAESICNTSEVVNTISNVAMSAVQINKKMTSMVNDAMPSITNFFNAYAEYSKALAESASQIMSKIEIPKISLPKIKISDDLIRTVKKFRCINLYREAEWPLFFIDNENLINSVAKINIEEQSWKKELETTIVDFFDEYGIEVIVDWWWNDSDLSEERKEILREAIELFNKGYYYGSVSLAMCQVLGIINTTYKRMVDAGNEFDIETVELMYKQYSGISLSSKEKNKIKNNNLGNERKQLICISTEIDEAVLLWDSAINYIWNIVLTSDNKFNNSNHPCRNKICHGVQMNYGTKEHALKALLVIDIALKLDRGITLEQTRKGST